MTGVKLSNEEKTELVQEAQEKLCEVITLLERAKLSRYERAYVIDHLKVIAGREHGFLTRDRNLDDVIDALENGAE